MIEARLKGRVGGFELDAALSIPSQGVTALIGPSGSGKTTLLRCIAGLTRLKGEVRVDGETWQDGRRFRPPHLRAVGYVFQEPSLFAHLSVRENLLFGLRRHRGPAGLGLEDVTPLLGLAPLLERSTAALSGGERQRVAIGRALLRQPQLLLMDEPVSSLDADSKAEILPYLDRLHRTLSFPVIYVTHDMGEVIRLADRAIRMRDGCIEPAPEVASLASGADGSVDGVPRERLEALALAALLAGLEPAARPAG